MLSQDIIFGSTIKTVIGKLQKSNKIEMTSRRIYSARISS